MYPLAVKGSTSRVRNGLAFPIAHHTVIWVILIRFAWVNIFKEKNLQHRIYSRVSYRIVSQYMVVHACSCYLWYLKALELFLASCHRGALTSGDAGILTAWQNITIPELVPWISSKHSGKPWKTNENHPFSAGKRWFFMVFPADVP